MNRPPHTPGPWFAVRHRSRPEGPAQAVIVSPNPHAGVDVPIGAVALSAKGRPQGEGRANAALVAAAPALLSALKRVIHANAVFREALPPELQVNPVNDACWAARAVVDLVE